MARRIPLPRLSRRQRRARWQRERRQQAFIVVIFSAVLFFVLGLISWAASDKFYQDNLKPAMRFEGRAVAMRDWKNEVKYEQTRFYVEFGVPAGYENDPQIAEQKASFERSSLDALVEHSILDLQARADGVTIAPDAIDARYQDDWGQFRSRHILIQINKDAPDQTLDVEVLGPDPVERRQGAAEDMVTAAEGSGAFQGPEVGEFFDNAERRLVPLRVAANRTGLDRIEVAADRTGPHRLSPA